MQFTFKTIAAPLLLASFLSAALFGFVAMSSGQDGRMEGGCPFSATGAAFCPQGASAAVLHHVSAYQSFLNVPLGFTADLLMLISAVFLVFFNLFLYRPRVLLSYRSPPLTSQDRKILRWLSLFEHSPSRS